METLPPFRMRPCDPCGIALTTVTSPWDDRKVKVRVHRAEFRVVAAITVISIWYYLSVVCVALPHTTIFLPLSLSPFNPGCLFSDCVWLPSPQRRLHRLWRYCNAIYLQPCREMLLLLFHLACPPKYPQWHWDPLGFENLETLRIASIGHYEVGSIVHCDDNMPKIQLHL